MHLLSFLKDKRTIIDDYGTGSIPCYNSTIKVYFCKEEYMFIGSTVYMYFLCVISHCGTGC